ncbi:tetratricopeptide repeat protein [Microbulbifer mangrovi]|uniref:tetratricopeptide repeat protein n=1 Tax=Microbulbifer mangrovi TaxID=927787 RepID=UPI0009905293|nr:hypothetical protein [Microbulbifer mangrovi]
MSFSAVIKRSPLALTLAAIVGSAPLYANTGESEASNPAAESAEPASTRKFQQAQDMRYGAALYHYFQGNTFDALSTLMVSDVRGDIVHHRDNAELIRGGISLAFGLERQAASLFEQQLQKTADENNRQRITRFREIAWLKLAELNYRQQNWDTAALQLEKSGAMHQSDLPLNLAIRSGDLEQAHTLLGMASLPVPKQVLGHSNLAAALARQQQLAAAADEYRRAATLVEQYPDADDELRVLRDKARIGAGYALALNNDYAGAAQEFQSVRLDTPWSPQALLGLGWASVNGEEYQRAVDALSYLIQQNPLSPEVQEALLALPFSYEMLRRPKLALKAYEGAEQKYLQALSDLATLFEASGRLQFAEIDVEENIDLRRYGWLEDARTPAFMRINQKYLLQMMQSDRLQMQLSQLRDLRHLKQVLEQWQQRLPEFDNLIEEREQRRVAIVQQHDSAQYDQQVQIAERELATLKTNLARIETQQDGLAMLATAGGEEAEFLRMLRAAEARYQNLSNAGKTSNYQRQTLARARGILQWQAAEQYHENLWQKRKSISQLEEQLVDAARRQRNVARIAADAPQLNLLADGIESAGQRIAQQKNAIERASAAIETSIRQDMRNTLEAAKVRVEGYMAHARLSIARIQDAAVQGMYDLPPQVPEMEGEAATDTPSAAPAEPAAESDGPARGTDSPEPGKNNSEPEADNRGQQIESPAQAVDSTEDEDS